MRALWLLAGWRCGRRGEDLLPKGGLVFDEKVEESAHGRDPWHRLGHELVMVTKFRERWSSILVVFVENTTRQQVDQNKGLKQRLSKGLRKLSGRASKSCVAVTIG